MDTVELHPHVTKGHDSVKFVVGPFKNLVGTNGGVAPFPRISGAPELWEEVIEVMVLPAYERHERGLARVGGG